MIPLEPVSFATTGRPGFRSSRKHDSGIHAHIRRAIVDVLGVPVDNVLEDEDRL